MFLIKKFLKNEFDGDCCSVVHSNNLLWFNIDELYVFKEFYFEFLLFRFFAYQPICFFAGDGEKQPVSTDVADCNDEYCKITRNVATSLNITFKTVNEAKDLRCKVRAQALGMWVPYPLGKLSKVCENLSNGTCPLAANTEATYTFSMTVPAVAVVGMKLTAEYKIIDQSKATVACIRVPLFIAA